MDAIARAKIVSAVRNAFLTALKVALAETVEEGKLGSEIGNRIMITDGPGSDGLRVLYVFEQTDNDMHDQPAKFAYTKTWRVSWGWDRPGNGAACPSIFQVGNYDFRPGDDDLSALVARSVAVLTLELQQTHELVRKLKEMHPPRSRG